MLFWWNDLRKPANRLEEEQTGVGTFGRGVTTSASQSRIPVARSEDKPHGQRFFHPAVKFETADGRAVVTISSWGWWRRPWPVGHIVSVHYKPTNPRWAEIRCFANVCGMPPHFRRIDSTSWPRPVAFRMALTGVTANRPAPRDGESPADRPGGKGNSTGGTGQPGGFPRPAPPTPRRRRGRQRRLPGVLKWEAGAAEEGVRVAGQLRP